MARSRILTVKILTDASGAARGLSAASGQYSKFTRALGKDSATAGTRAGDYLVSGIDSVLGKGLKLAGGAGAAILGTSLFQGFNRLNDIDQATAKLRGLGHSAEDVQTIMDNALASVKGTSFGLGEAAGTAAQLVAAGIQPGKQLEATLKTVADAATIGGTSMDDMGAIFGKVAASNRLNGDVINQMTERGIPVLQLLADHYGVTADAARQMVSNGQVDFQNFSDAMNKGMGGAALESGNTMEGAWKNTMAALGRIGANLLEPIFGDVKGGLKDLPTLLAPIEEKAKQVGQAFGDMLDWVKDNWDMIKNIGKAAGVAIGVLLGFRVIVGVMQAFQAIMTIVKVAQAAFIASSYGTAGASYALTAATTAQKVAFLGGVVAQKAATAAQWLFNAAMSANPIMLVVLGIAALVAAFVILWVKCEGFRNFFIAMWGVIKAAALAVWNWMKTAWQAVVNVWNATINWFKGVFTAIWNGIKVAFQAVWNVLKTIVLTYVNIWITIIKTIIAVFAAVWNAVKAAAQAVWNAMKVAWQAVVNAWKATIDWFKGIFQGIWNGIKAAAQAVWDAITGFIRNQVNGWRAVFDGIKNFVSGVWDGIKNAASSALNPIMGIIDGVKNAFDRVVGAVRTVIDWIKKISIPKMPDWLTGIFGGSADINVGYTATAAPMLAAARGTRSAWAPVPSLASPRLATAGDPAEVTVININGGLDSADTIARRLRELLDSRDRRASGIRLARRVA